MATVPLFPLGLVLVPGLVLPLHVFEPRYRALVRDLLDRPEAEREFGVVAIRQGREVGAGAHGELHDVGCTARVRRVSETDDGRYELVTTGERRFRLEGLVDAGTPYLTGEVTWLDDGTVDDETVVLAGAVRTAVGVYRDALVAAQGGAADEPDGDLELPQDPAELSWVVTAALVVDLEPQQALLAQPTTTARLKAELALLRRETTLLRTTRALPAPDLARQGWSPN